MPKPAIFESFYPSTPSQLREFIKALDDALLLYADPEIKKGKEAYMRNKFAFFGIKAPQLKEISRPFFVRNRLPVKKEMVQIVKILWQRPEREYQYFAQEFAFKYINHLDPDHIDLFEYMIVHKSWWDTVDFIAGKLIGGYFRVYPEYIPEYTSRWLMSNNIWLQRSAVIFQLKYKEETDTALLSHTIHTLLGSKEFFINKAIGWALREYSKTDPNWVVDFIEKTELSNLSKREAIRLLDE